jgi:drug/metabolite transporter (DMT)-like permease
MKACVVSIALAFFSAVVWGASDYSGGRATRRGTALAVTVASQLLGAPVLAAGVLLLPGTGTERDLHVGNGAGVVLLLAVVLLYASLSTGAMSVAAPVTAVTGALLPTAVGLAQHESPSPVALVGVGCAVVAIALVSIGPASGGRAGLRVIALAFGSGVLFGLYFVILARTDPASGLWPLVGARLASLVLGLLLVLAQVLRNRPGVPALGRRTFGWIALAGVGDITANALYLLAVRHGLLSLVAPIAALYPVSTVLLALGLDRERVRPIQVVGLGLAATALVLATM